MPTLEVFDDIKINIYNGDHRPAHIHVLYNEYEVLITIEYGRIYAGELPEKQLRKALSWLKDNSEWALSVFYELNPTLK